MLHSVQHLFLSTESPSLPCVETKTQTKKKKRCVSPLSTSQRKKRRTGGSNLGCYTKAMTAKGLPFLISPSLAPTSSQPCPSWGHLQVPSTFTLVCTGSSACHRVPHGRGAPGTSLSLPFLSLYCCSLAEGVTQTQSFPCHLTLMLPPDALFLRDPKTSGGTALGVQPSLQVGETNELSEIT